MIDCIPHLTSGSLPSCMLERKAATPLKFLGLVLGVWNVLALRAGIDAVLCSWMSVNAVYQFDRIRRGRPLLFCVQSKRNSV